MSHGKGISVENFHLQLVGHEKLRHVGLDFHVGDVRRLALVH